MPENIGYNRAQPPNKIQLNMPHPSGQPTDVHYDKAEAVEIRWPSGIVQKLANVAADRVIRVKEAVR